MSDNQTIPKADQWQAYNYIMLFSSGNIKIGMTTDPQKRIKQLSNSNSGGFKLIDYVFSDAIYIADRVEQVFHSKYRNNRLEGEFFGDLDWDIIKEDFMTTLNSPSILRLNNQRKTFCFDHNMQLSEYKAYMKKFRKRQIVTVKKDDYEPIDYDNVEMI